MSLSRKNTVILGGAGGIGLAICKSLLQNGIKNLLIIDIHGAAESIEFLTEAVPAATGKIQFEICDCTNTELLKTVLKSATEKFGGIDILINSVGVVCESTPSKCIDINLSSVIHSTLIGIELMAKHKNGSGGHIINIASIAGLAPLGDATLCVYAASKYGVVGFTRALATSSSLVETTNIKFSIICPGMTETPLLSSFRKGILFPELNLKEQMKITRKMQSPDVVGECVLKAITEGENGATWVCSEGKIYVLKEQENLSL